LRWSLTSGLVSGGAVTDTEANRRRRTENDEERNQGERIQAARAYGDIYRIVDWREDEGDGGGGGEDEDASDRWEIRDVNRSIQLERDYAMQGVVLHHQGGLVHVSFTVFTDVFTVT
jgi:hypothetical protein